jgi:hypothetical protein
MPQRTELEISAAFAERWYELSEHIARDLISSGCLSEFHEIYSRLIGIAADVLGELEGLSSAEMKELAHRWLSTPENEARCPGCGAQELNPGPSEDLGKGRE